MYSKIYLQLLLNIIGKLITCSSKITLYHASDYGGIFEELPNRNGKLVGGLSRVKHRLADPNVKFIFTGNFIHKPYAHGRPRQEIEIALLEYLRPEVVVLGQNEYFASRTTFDWFLESTHFRIISSTVTIANKRRKIDSIYQLERDIRMVSYNDESITHLPGAIGQTIYNPWRKLNAMTVEDKWNFTIAVGCAGMEEIKDRIRSTNNIQLFFTGCSKSAFQWQSEGRFSPENVNITSKYPLEMLNYKGEKVLVAHSYGSTKFLGKMEIETDGKGTLLEYKGEMIYLDDAIPPDPNVKALIESLKTIEVAKSKVFLNGECSTSECNLGNLITDAFIQYKVDTFNNDEFWTDVSIALMPAGNIKASIDTIANGGFITMTQLSQVFPQKQKLVTFKVKGDQLMKSIELALNDAGKTGTDKFLQVSGLMIRYDSRNDPQHRLAVRVRCAKCKIPSYSSLKRSDMYNIITTANLAAGAFGHHILGNLSKIEIKERLTDMDAVVRYVRALKIVRVSRSDRIVRIGQELNPEISLGKLSKSVFTTVLGITCLFYLFNKWIIN